MLLPRAAPVRRVHLAPHAETQYCNGRVLLPRVSEIGVREGVEHLAEQRRLRQAGGRHQRVARSCARLPRERKSDEVRLPFRIRRRFVIQEQRRWQRRLLRRR